MTAKEIAIELLNSAEFAWADLQEVTLEAFVPIIAKAITKGILQEREECAKVAEEIKQKEMMAVARYVAADIALAIRERGKQG